jgi:hypothetical protein
VTPEAQRSFFSVAAGADVEVMAASLGSELINVNY